ARRLRPAAEIRCVPAVVGDRGVCGGFSEARRRACPRGDPGAVRSHRRGQPASESGAVCARRRPRTRAVLAMMELIARWGGNVRSEHGVGTRKRDYVSMSRTEADIAAMRAVKT